MVNHLVPFSFAIKCSLCRAVQEPFNAGGLTCRMKSQYIRQDDPDTTHNDKHTGSQFQISVAYSSMHRSLLKKPILATLVIVFVSQSS